MPSKTEKLLSLLNGQPVIPVLKIANVADAVPLARALARGGLPAIEITLRTADALEAIRRVAGEVEGAIVGSGTILDAKQFDEAAAAGSKFIVSPGITRELLAAAKDSDVPLLPGAITPGEIMAAREAGLRFLKFFPAEQSGGIASLKAFASPLADVKFCPDRRRFGQERHRLSEPAQRHLRRWFVGGPGRPGQGRQMGRDRGPRAGREQTRKVGAFARHEKARPACADRVCCRENTVSCRP